VLDSSFRLVLRQLYNLAMETGNVKALVALYR
jgi:hypothetical protein